MGHERAPTPSNSRGTVTLPANPAGLCGTGSDLAGASAEYKVVSAGALGLLQRCATELHFTPFGYLRNPFAAARSWEEGEGGGLRATLERPGFGWEYPWPRGPTAGAGLELGCGLGERSWRSRADFAELGYHSAYHSSLVFSYDWRLPGLDVRPASCWPSGTCCCAWWTWSPTSGAGASGGGSLAEARLEISLRGWRREGQVAARLDGHDGRLDLGDDLPPHWLILDPTAAEHGHPVVGSDSVTFPLPIGDSRGA